jgi:nucleoprotein TPR
MAAAVAVDVGFISSSYNVPESTVQTLIDAPTVELVASFLQSLSERAQEFELLKQEKLRTDVELESAVHSSEHRARQLRESVDKGLKETESLRKQLSDSGVLLSRAQVIFGLQANNESRKPPTVLDQ